MYYSYFLKIWNCVQNWYECSKCWGWLWASWRIQFPCPIFCYFTKNEFHWISNEFPISSLRRSNNCPASVPLPLTPYISLTNHHMPPILLDFKNGGFVLKLTPFVSIYCFIYLLKTPQWKNLSEFPISSFKTLHWKWNK